MNRIEVLAPAGNLEKLKIAYLYGADAVYIGGKGFNLRTKAGNFSLSEIKEARKISQFLNKKLYVALNVFLCNSDVEKAITYLKILNNIKVDALIIADPGIIYLAKEYAPDIPIHLSTQANTQNWAACLYWQKQGIERIILGREVSLKEINNIHQRVDVNLEAFVHGAMCMAYSGRCILSMHMTGKSANSGNCTHPCRWKYYVIEKQRPEDAMLIEEDDFGTYIFNSKDLCMLPYLPDLIKSGVTNFKIEGRMKSIHYVATVTKIYKRAVSLIESGADFSKAMPTLMNELNRIGERDYTTGFYLGVPDSTIQQYYPKKTIDNIRFVGKVIGYGDSNLLKIEQRNKFVLGDTIEVLMPRGENKTLIVKTIINEDNEAINEAPNPKEILYINGLDSIVPGALLRLRS